MILYQLENFALTVSRKKNSPILQPYWFFNPYSCFGIDPWVEEIDFLHPLSVNQTHLGPLIKHNWDYGPKTCITRRLCTPKKTLPPHHISISNSDVHPPKILPYQSNILVILNHTPHRILANTELFLL